MSLFRDTIKSVLILLGVIGVVQFVAHADSVTFNMQAATLRTAAGQPMPVTGLVVLVANTNGSQFGNPTASTFVSGDNIELARWDLSAFGTEGILFDAANNLGLFGGWNSGDALAIYWYPTLTTSATSPGTGTSYGFYRDASGLDGGAAWVTPSSGTVTLKFLTQSVGGSNPDSAGLASLVVGNHPPVANPDGPFLRAPSLSLKIAITNLLANDTDADTNALAFTGIVGNSTNGAVLTTNANYVFYPSNAGNVTDQFSYTISDGQGGASTGLVSIAISTNVYGQALSITNAGGSYIATFAGIPTYNYTVRRATDVNFTVNVTNLVTTNAPDSGLFKWTDSAPPSPTAFYRLYYNP